MELIDYLWPFGQYRDANAGSQLERAAAYRYNRQLSRALPGYLNRWLAICCVLLTASMVCPGWLVPVIGTVFTLAFCILVHIAHVYLLFRRSCP